MTDPALIDLLTAIRDNGQILIESLGYVGGLLSALIIAVTWKG